MVARGEARRIPHRRRLRPGRPPHRARIVGATPIRRIGLPEEVAEAAALLAAPSAAFITGQVLSVNGGVAR